MKKLNRDLDELAFAVKDEGGPVEITKERFPTLFKMYANMRKVNDE